MAQATEVQCSIK